jgi:hypothetical protein
MGIKIFDPDLCVFEDSVSYFHKMDRFSKGSIKGERVDLYPESGSAEPRRFGPGLF